MCKIYSDGVLVFTDDVGYIGTQIPNFEDELEVRYNHKPDEDKFTVTKVFELDRVMLINTRRWLVETNEAITLLVYEGTPDED